MPDMLNTPHGGTLVDLLATGARLEALRAEAAALPALDLTPRQLCDLELILNGGFSPLKGFLNRKDYDGVCASMRLASGALWPMPITLDLPEALAKSLKPGGRLALRDAERNVLAVLTIEDLWQPDREAEAKAVFGTTDALHPGASYLLKQVKPWYAGGPVEGLALPAYYDFTALRQTPAQVRAEFAHRGWNRVVAFQTRNPMHRAHVELTHRAARDAGAKLLIHPVVGLTRPGDVDHYTRVRCYRKLLARYPEGSAMLSLLPLAMRMGGPREAVWHAIIRKNHGVTHFIVGRDHAGPGKDSAGKPFYGPYDAQELLRQHAAELTIEMVEFKMMVYVKEQDAYFPEDQVPAGSTVLNISGTEQRQLLNEGRDIPAWFTYPEVVEELRHQFPPRRQQGFTVFFTGLSASGKSTIARALMIKLLELGPRPVTVLDGDEVRLVLSKGLGFSREDRDLNIRRIGMVATEVTKNGGAAICCPIAPYDAARKEVRKAVAAEGGFLLVHLATPVATCEARDPKGLYAKARTGEVQHFTGVSDPYEPPGDAELVLDTTTVRPAEAVERILAWLAADGFIPGA